MGEILAARRRMFPLQRIAAGRRIDRDQDKIAGVRIIKPQRIRQLGGRGEMQEAVGLVMGRAAIVAAGRFPVGAGHDLVDEHHAACAVPPTVSPSRRSVGWPTPTGTDWPFLPQVPTPVSSFMSLPIMETRVSDSGPLPIRVAPLMAWPRRPSSMM